MSPAPESLLRDGWLVQLCVARACMGFVYMTYAAALPLLRETWDMSGTAAGSIATSAQLGYAISLMGNSWLADRIGARRVFMTSGVASAVTALAFALFARSYLSGIVLYTLVSLAAGGTYTTMIMLLADRYPPERRGAAVGWLIASISLGYACSLALTGLALPLGGYPLAFLVTVPRRELRALRIAGARLGAARRVSTLCSFAWGWMVAWPATAVVGAIYGFSALGDSPVLSTAVTETVKPAYLGSALALRSLLGFGAGAIAPLAFGVILDVTNPARASATEWGWPFVALGAGGLIATVCAWRLARDRE